MRVRIVFSLLNRGAFVPFHHQFILAQTIKGIIMQGGKQEFMDYHRYNFSGLKGQTRVSRKGLHFYSSKITLVFATPGKPFLDYFMEMLFKMEDLMIGTLHVVPESYGPEDPVVIGETVKFLCISPLVVLQAKLNDEQGKRFISPQDEEFSDLLYDQTMERMEASGQYSPEQLSECYKFQLVADQEYIMRIQESRKKFARIYPLFDADVKYEVRGYTFPFTLYAPALVQEFLYENGIGWYSHKGFGMVDVSRENSDAVASNKASVDVA